MSAEAAPEGGGATSTGGRERGTRRLARRVVDHIGMLTGGFLAVLAFAGLVFLAAIGFDPAAYLLVFVAAGVLIIAVGGRIRGR